MASVTLSPSTMADDATVGTVAWTTPDNAKASDDVYATATLSNNISHYLKATNFGFAIPNGATIDGILLEVEAKSTVTTGSVILRVLKDGTPVGTGYTPGGSITTVEAYKDVGGATQLFEQSWTPGDINSSNFGAVFYTYLNTTLTLSVDHMRITVYYTESSVVSPFPSHLNT